MRTGTRLALATMALLSFGCSESPAGPEPKPQPKVWAKGWHDAGLALSEGDVRAGGVSALAVVGDRMLAATYSGKLFLSRPGVRSWDSIVPPSGALVYSISAWDSLFFIGTQSPGEVWSYAPGAGTWRNLRIGDFDSTKITTLLAFEGGVAAFVSKRTNDSLKFPMKWDAAMERWTELQKGWPKSYSALVSLALGDTLYFGTWEVGLWRWTPGDSTWVRLPDPIVQTVEGPPIVKLPRSLALHDGQLYVGHLIDGVFRMGLDGNNPVQQQMDTVRGKYKSLTKDALGLLSHRGYLFVGGTNPFTPAVLLPGATGFLYLTDNWCRDDWGEEYICQGSLSPAFAALGDTVYAAGGGRILKIGLSDLPK